MGGEDWHVPTAVVAEASAPLEAHHRRDGDAVTQAIVVDDQQLLTTMLTHAQEAESCGFKDIAGDKYRDAARLLLDKARISDNEAEKFALTLQADEYLDRCKTLLGSKPNVAEISNAAAPFAVPTMPAPAPAPRREEENFSPEQIKSGASLMGVGIGGILGSLLGLPIIGGIVGFFAAGHYVSQDSEYGAHARNLGVVGARTIEKSKEVNDKYDVTGRAQSLASSVWEKSKEIEKQHDISGKVKGAASATYEKTAQLNRDYRVSERIFNSVNKALESLNGGTGGPPSSNNNNPPRNEN